LVGTVTYSLGEGWRVTDGFYFAVCTLTTSSIADPNLTLTHEALKIFTAFYVLTGIGILVELARQLGVGYVRDARGERRHRTHPASQGRAARGLVERAIRRAAGVANTSALREKQNSSVEAHPLEYPARSERRIGPPIGTCNRRGTTLVPTDTSKTSRFSTRGDGGDTGTLRNAST